jgi:Ca-activated chloride channel homolog
LLQAQQAADVIPFLTRVTELAPNEPQSWRDLGLAYAATGASNEAIKNLWQVVSQPWHGRFPGVTQGGDTSIVDPRLQKTLPVDLRVVLAWDADDTDIDLWVTDPNGEKVYYGHRLSYQGGRISNDFTDGYGPEEFLLKTAKPGKYQVRAEFYGHNQQVVAPATSLMMKLSTHFGQKNQKDEVVILRLAGQAKQVLVGEFTVK